MSVHAPFSGTKTAPRRGRGIRYRPHVYKYTFDAEPDPMEIVYALINGLDINDVDPQLFPAILPLLKEKERQLKEWRNQPASKTIEASITFISNYRFSEDPNQNPGMASARSLASGNGPSKADIEYAVSLVSNGYDPATIDPMVRNQVIERIKKLRFEAVNKGDYILADTCANAYRRLLAIISEERYEEITTAKAEDFKQRFYTASEEAEQIKEEWNQKVEQAKIERDRTLQKLTKDDAKELKEFDKIFEAEVPPERRKFSAALLQLRRRERYMVVSGRYIEAADVRKEADEMEAAETAAHQEKWHADLLARRKEFIRKQEEKHAVRADLANRAYEKVCMEAQKAIETAERSAKCLEANAESMARTAQNAKKSTTGSTTSRSIKGLMTARNSQVVGKEKTQAELFRQRAKINTIVYTKSLTPRGRQKMI